MAKRGPKGPITADHKARMAQGRAQARDVRAYLDFVAVNAPRRGRKRTAESVRARLAHVEQALPTADALASLHLIQERIDLHEELAAMRARADASVLEDAFVKVANNYGLTKGISYAAWRTMGVPASVLAKARIGRNS